MEVAAHQTEEDNGSNDSAAESEETSRSSTSSGESDSSDSDSEQSIEETAPSGESTPSASQARSMALAAVSALSASAGTPELKTGEGESLSELQISRLQNMGNHRLLSRDYMKQGENIPGHVLMGRYAL